MELLWAVRREEKRATVMADSRVASLVMKRVDYWEYSSVLMMVSILDLRTADQSEEQMAEHSVERLVVQWIDGLVAWMDERLVAGRAEEQAGR